jgi:hypothetical protein
MEHVSGMYDRVRPVSYVTVSQRQRCLTVSLRYALDLVLLLDGIAIG